MILCIPYFHTAKVKSRYHTCKRLFLVKFETHNALHINHNSSRSLFRSVCGEHPTPVVFFIIHTTHYIYFFTLLKILHYAKICFPFFPKKTVFFVKKNNFIMLHSCVTTQFMVWCYNYIYVPFFQNVTYIYVLTWL